MRLCTAATIDTFAVHRYDRDVMLYLGERSGSILMPEAEATTLRDQLSAILPKPDSVSVQSLVLAIRNERAARANYHAARDDFDRQVENDRLIRAEAAVDAAIAALKTERAKVAA